MFDDDPEWDLAILSYIHDHIIDASGGSKGLHDEGLVKSALARPLHSVMGEDAYPNVFLKAAALLDAIARNHGFRDGNKRTAMAAAALYLEQNDIKVAFTNQEYEDIMLHVVNDKPSIEEIKKWLKDHVVDHS
jgi:death-on-curing protein